MTSIINYFLSIVSSIVDILNRRLFPDMPITYLQLILGCILIKFIFSFIFGGFKDIDTDKNNFVRSGVKYSNNKIKDRERKKEIIRRRGDK